IFLGKQTSQDAAEDRLAPASLVYVVCHLRNRQKVITVDFLILFNAYCFALFLSHLVYLRRKSHQKIPRQPVEPPVGQNESFGFEFRDEKGECVEIRHLAEPCCVKLREQSPL